MGNNLHRRIGNVMLLITLLLYAVSALAEGDIYLPGIQLYQTSLKSHSKKQYTVINEKNYHRIMQYSNNEISVVLENLTQIRQTLAASGQERNAELIAIIKKFTNKPYTLIGAQGEGDGIYTITSHIDTRHIQQDPLYRTDAFNCMTLVETVIALFQSDNLDDFKQQILKIEYGTAQLPQSNQIHYCNRNNFTSKDFNPINQAHGYMKDITTILPFSEEAKTVSVSIDPNKWMYQQYKNSYLLRTSVRTFNAATGKLMAKRLTDHYVHQFCPRLKTKNVSMRYIPKSSLVKKMKQGVYLPDRKRLQQIPTPAIAEIVRNDKKWVSKGRPIGYRVGTGIIVSHLGLLTHQTFTKGETIYQKILCNGKGPKRACHVIPVICQHAECPRLMFTHATDAYPDTFYYYKTAKGNVCGANKPSAIKHYSYCNRVHSIPLGDYLAQKQYGRYLYMDNASLLGINFQKLI